MTISALLRTAAGVAGLALAAVTLTSPAHAAGTAFHLDCSAATNGDGTIEAPWNSLDAASHAYGPGDRLLLKRGTTCQGTLNVTGSGSPAQPMIIADYGNADSRAVIDGNGTTSGILLDNVQHVSVRDLEVINAANPGTDRTGVRIEIQDLGTGEGYRLENLYIHDIWGSDTKWAAGSQGIGLVVREGTVPTRFHDVVITGNTISGVDRQAIHTVASAYGTRPEEGSNPDQPTNWFPSTGIVISHNTVSDIGGDGIVINTTDGARVERNTVTGFQRRSEGYNAGIWAYNADHTLFQYNDVSGGETHRDGMAYDIDQGNTGTTFRYNYSHDNAGGAFLLCNNGAGVIRDGEIRHNFSTNDSFRGVENCQGEIESVRMHHNSFYIGDGTSQTVINENNTNRRAVNFEDNVVTKEGAGSADLVLRSGGYAFSGNRFSNVTGVPDQSGEPGHGACAPGAFPAFRGGLTDQAITDEQGSLLGLRPGAAVGDWFGAGSTQAVPNGLSTRLARC